MVAAFDAYDARTKLILTAERLYSEVGPGVALRDIAKAAGQRNNSAVSYHFGSRDGLVAAILELRVGAMEQAWRSTLETVDESTTIPQLVRMLAEPILVLPYAQGSTHYARFLEAIRSYHVVSSDQSSANWPGLRQLLSAIGERLPQLPSSSRRLRLRSLGTAMFAIAADVERDREAHRRSPDLNEVVTMLAALALAQPIRDP